MKLRLALPIALAWLALAGPAPAGAACPEAGGIGGTGARAEGGIGGTGGRAEGGIGGTGATAESEIGLLGVITGFGSICVNGVEVHYDSTTPVTVNGQPGAAGALALGQTVAVRASGAGDQARAHAISVLDAAVGPVTATDRTAGTVHVVGQSVRLGASTVFGPGLSRDAVRGASAGETLRVSGLRTADGTIEATRIERAAPGTALVYGPLSLDGGVPRVGNARIEAQEATLKELAAAQGPMLFVGRARDGQLVAEQVFTDPTGRALAPGRFIAQGYVSEVGPGQSLRAGGLQFALDAPGAGGLGRDELVRLYGRTDPDGRRVVERVDFLAEPLNPRPQAAPGAMPRAGDDRRGRGADEDRRGHSGPERGEDARGRSGPSERGERSGPGRGGADRPDRLERPERGDRPDRLERPDRSGPH